MIIYSFDPTSGGWLAFGLFYFVLFLSILGSLSLLGYGLRRFWNRKRGIPRIMVADSFRQATIFAAVVVVALWLQSGRILTWWNMLLLILLATFVEFAFLVFHSQSEKKFEN